jgi:predicted PurR-regulated permease PerM
VSGGSIAAVIAACALVVLVLMLAVPLLKLGRTLDEATLAIRKTSEGAVPLLADAQDTIKGVNAQLVEVDSITKGVSSMTSNAAALTSIVSSTVGSPLIKVAAFSYCVRKSVGKRREAEAVRASKQRHRAARRKA